MVHPEEPYEDEDAVTPDTHTTCYTVNMSVSVDLETQVQILTTVLAEELVHLWDDLSLAIRHALNGKWSIQCDDLSERIATITHVVGPTDPDSIQMPLLLDGTYDRIHQANGIVSPTWDRARIESMWNNYLNDQGGTVTPIRP